VVSTVHERVGERCVGVQRRRQLILSQSLREAFAKEIIFTKSQSSVTLQEAASRTGKVPQ
jgi:hypothetical protein